MRYSAAHKQATRNTLIKAAGEVFRLHGFAGVGVDGLATAANVTSGALYKSFKSKSEIFEEVVRVGVARLANRLRAYCTSAKSSNPVDDYITASLSRQHRASPAKGCALPTLTVEIMRATSKTKEIYQSGILSAAKVMAEMPPLSDSRDAEDIAIAILALVSGGVSMSRAFATQAEADRVAEAVRRAASHLAHTGLRGAKPATGAKWVPAG